MDRGAKGHAPHQFSNIVSAHCDSIGLDACYGCVPQGIFIGFAHQALSFHLLENFRDGTRQFTAFAVQFGVMYEIDKQGKLVGTELVPFSHSTWQLQAPPGVRGAGRPMVDVDPPPAKQ